jgi:LPS sulfotransferase NodH
MVSPYNAYILCGTPRSGSTLLCEMLWATRAAGRPNSFFRELDIAEWADAWGVPHPHSFDDAAFDRAYLKAMVREGSAQTGIFGIRIMWASMADAERRLGRALGRTGDLTELFALAFGQPLYLHVTRKDKVAQAISRVRAEQSGVWHLTADRNVLEGTHAPGPTVYDHNRIAALVAELEEHDPAWEKFFTERAVEPMRLEYESTVADPQKALRQVLQRLGADPALADDIEVPTAKMGDGTSEQWARRFREEAGMHQPST